MKAKMLRTIKNGWGDIFRKGSTVNAEKMYGGYRITKEQKHSNGTTIQVTRVKKTDFKELKKKTKANGN
jgi:hypothetical protein